MLVAAIFAKSKPNVNAKCNSESRRKFNTNFNAEFNSESKRKFNTDVNAESGTNFGAEPNRHNRARFCELYCDGNCAQCLRARRRPRDCCRRFLAAPKTKKERSRIVHVRRHSVG